MRLSTLNAWGSVTNYGVQTHISKAFGDRSKRGRTSSPMAPCMDSSPHSWSLLVLLVALVAVVFVISVVTTIFQYLQFRAFTDHLELIPSPLRPRRSREKELPPTPTLRNQISAPFSPDRPPQALPSSFRYNSMGRRDPTRISSPYLVTTTHGGYGSQV